MPDQRSENWHLLLIDDDEEDYMLTRLTLKDAVSRAIELEWADSYLAGKQRLASKQYDAVLVDYDLGGETGIDLIRETVGTEYPAPLILYTGRGGYAVDLEAMQAGATLYLAKQEVNPLLLERAIRYAIERKRIEKELEQALAHAESVNRKLSQNIERQSLLAEAAAELLAGADPMARLDDFFQRMSESLGLEVYVQYNVSPEGTCLLLGKQRGFAPRHQKVLARLEFGHAVCGTVAQIRQPIYVNEVQQSQDRKVRLIRSMGITTYACHPLIVHDELLGTLSFGSRTESRFDPETIDLLRTFCNLVATALWRKKFEEKLLLAQEPLQTQGEEQ